jgi:hypothetical protein
MKRIMGEGARAGKGANSSQNKSGLGKTKPA